ncbi:MAG: hypothetical protein IKS41_06800 [Alphaproteobacteria bacterium]|nr:hypothetical protein [Alphaproteobacteria bacterium]
MKLEKVKVNKKYRIKFKDEKKPFTINAVIVGNNAEENALEFKFYDDIYKCQYSDILKIQSLIKFKLKMTLWTLGVLISLPVFAFLGYRFYEYKNCKIGSSCGDYTFSLRYGRVSLGCVAKPIIYLYPEKTTNVTVTLGYPEKAIHTYPKYNKPWQVQAEPNGDLMDLNTGRHYYALYWEGKKSVSTSNPTEGFIVAGKDTISFLEDKLDQLGLTEREANEFIVYWLPKLENVKYNLIRFQTLSEQNKNMPLDITPTPRTLIRVMMEYKNLDKLIQVKEQVLPQKPQRNGFTVVEWGGTKI